MAGCDWTAGLRVAKSMTTAGTVERQEEEEEREDEEPAKSLAKWRTPRCIRDRTPCETENTQIKHFGGDL